MAARYPWPRRRRLPCGDQRRGRRAIEPVSEDSADATVGQQSLKATSYRPGEQCMEPHLGFDGTDFSTAARCAREARAVDACTRAPPSMSRPCSRRSLKWADLLEALDHDAEQLNAQAQAQQPRRAVSTSRARATGKQRGRPAGLGRGALAPAGANWAMSGPCAALCDTVQLFLHWAAPVDRAGGGRVESTGAP